MAWNDTKVANDDFGSVDWNAMVTDQELRAYTSSGAGAPSSTPTMIGAIYVDTVGGTKYIAVGTSSSADWKSTMSGPTSAIDNAIARFDGTTGLIIQNSGPTINDTGELDMSSQKITSLLDPTTDQEAATKKYVDDQITAEDFWDRSGTSLIPNTAGDDIGLTGTRINKIWATDLEVTNDIAGSITGTAPTLKTARTIAGVSFDGSANISLNNNAITNGAGYTTNTGDMILADVQSVTELKTFDKDKIATKGTSTGVTVISTANSSANDYTATLQAGTGTIAYTSDITGTNSGTNTGDQDASEVLMDVVGTPTYDSVQDWSNSTQSAGIISGGVITDSGSGEVDISAVTGIVKETNSSIGVNTFFDLAGVENQTLTDESINYISLDYNSGTPQFVIGVTNTANGHTIFNLGKVYREGTVVDIITSGLHIDDLSKRLQQKSLEEAGLKFVSGGIVGETGTRQITVTSGVMYAGINRIITDAVNTSTGDTFEYYYYDGDAGPAVWVESDETAINNTQYNNVATGLATLSNNQYGIHWVYKGTNGNTYVIYGQDSYTLREAQAAQPPSSLPDHVEEMGVLRAKIIIKKSAAAFTEIESVEDVSFTSTTPSNHNELSGLQGGVADEYYHLTSAQHTISTQAATNALNGYMTSALVTNIETNNAKVTNATHTGEVTGSGALTIDKTAITAKGVVTAVGTDYVLISDTSDSGNLKKVLASDFGGSGSGDVVGPSSATDNAIARFDTTTGKLIQDSPNITISDNDTLYIDQNNTDHGLVIDYNSTITGFLVDQDITDASANPASSNIFNRMTTATDGGTYSASSAVVEIIDAKTETSGTVTMSGPALKITTDTTAGDIQLSNRSATPSGGAEGQIAYVNNHLEFQNGSTWEEVPKKHSEFNDQTGTTYTLALTDDDKTINLDNASAITLTVPPNSSVAFPIGTRIVLVQEGAGQVTVAQGAGVTIKTSQTLKMRAQEAICGLMKVATDTWRFLGDMEAA